MDEHDLFDERLRDALHSDDEVEVSAASADVVRLGLQRRLRRRVSLGVVAAVLIVGIVGTAAITNGSASGRLHVAGPSSGPTIRVTPTTVPATAAEIELNAEIVQPTVLAVDGQRLWVSGYAASPNGVTGPAHLQEFDARTGKLLGDVTLPDNAPFGLQVGDGAVWVSAGQGEASTEFLKIDIATLRVVARIPNIKDGALAVDANAVWATDLNFGPSSRGLRRINSTTGQMLTIANIAPSINPLGVVTGSDGVWVGNGSNGNVQRVDQTTNTAGPIINVGPDLADMIALNHSLWVERASVNQVVQVIGTKPTRTIDLGERTYGMATDGKALWFGTNAAHVLRVDADTGAITRVSLPTGTRAAIIASGASTGAVWIASTFPTPRLVHIPTPPTG
jgi:phage baseplate assembly protein gpV